MPTVPAALRAAALLRLNLSPALRGMALGVRRPAVFEFRVEALHKLYAADHPPLTGAAWAGAGPAGRLTVPLWASGTTVFAVAREGGRLTFFTFSLEDPAQRARPLARTEQGLWAALFVDAYEDGHSDDALAAAAAEVGFRFLPLLLVRWHAADQQTFGASQAFRQALADEIDGLDGQERG